MGVIKLFDDDETEQEKADRERREADRDESVDTRIQKPAGGWTPYDQEDEEPTDVTGQDDQPPAPTLDTPPITSQTIQNVEKQKAIESAIPNEVKAIKDKPFEEVYDKHLTPKQQRQFDAMLLLPRQDIDDEGNQVYDTSKLGRGMPPALKEPPEKVQARLQRYFRRIAEINLLYPEGEDRYQRPDGDFAPVIKPRALTEEEKQRAEEIEKLRADDPGAPTERELRYTRMLSKRFSERMPAATLDIVQQIRDPNSPLRINENDGSKISREDAWNTFVDDMQAADLEEWAPKGSSGSIMPHVFRKLGPEKGLQFLEWTAEYMQEPLGGAADWIYKRVAQLDQLMPLEKIGVDVPGVGEFYPFKNLSVESNARRAVGFVIDVIELLDPIAALTLTTGPAAVGMRLTEGATETAKRFARSQLRAQDRANKKLKDMGDERAAQAAERAEQAAKMGAGTPRATGIAVFDEAIDAGRTAVRVAARKKKVRKERQTRELFAADPDLAEATRAKLEAGRLMVAFMKGATQENLAAKAALAKEVADQNVSLREQLLKEFEVLTGKKVTKERVIMPETEVVDGKTVPKGTPVRQLVYDPAAARQAGLELTEEVSKLDAVLEARGTDREFEVNDADIAKLATGQDALTHPILNPDKLDAVVAIASDLKKAFPEKWNDKETVIDNLFRLTVEEELTGVNSPALMNILGAYGLNFEDYILTVVGSGSQAGRILQKFAQIGRARPKSAQQKANEKELQMRNAAHSNFIRAINVTRAALVSMFKTAMRNLDTGVIRSPFEAQANAMDNAIWRATEEGVVAGGKEYVSWNNWRDSFRFFKYMYNDPESAKELTDFLLENSEMLDQWNLMFNNINEIQQASGRGRGGLTDNILSELEDAVMVMNIPNRWQEFLVRRAIYLGDMERLIRREWDVDFLDELNNGKLYDFINNNPSLKPDGARSYEEITAEAVEHSLRYTFASFPDSAVFRAATSAMTKYGFTAIEHFPRFLFNQMELVGRYIGAGAGLTALRQVRRGIQHVQGKEKIEALTAKDRRRLGDWLSGSLMIGAAYGYLTAEDENGEPLAPADYKTIRINDGSEIESRPFSPIAQVMFIARFLKEIRDNSESGRLFDIFNLDDQAFFESNAWRGALRWFTMPTQVNNFKDTFLMGRTGIPSDLFGSITDIALLPTSVNADLFTKEERVARNVGKHIGNYLRKNLTWFFQFYDLDRATGYRTNEKKDFAGDPEYGNFERTLLDNMVRPLRQAGAFVSPEEERALPGRQRFYQRIDDYDYLVEEIQTRQSPLAEFLFGTAFTEPDSKAAEYLEGFGFGEYWGGLSPRTRVPSIRREEMINLRPMLPLIAAIIKGEQANFKEEYRDNKDRFPEFTEASYVKDRSREEIIRISKNYRAMFTKALGKKDYLATDPAYSAEMNSFRRLTASDQQGAIKDFKIKNGRDPDLTSTKDLALIVAYGKVRSDAIREIFGLKEKD